MTDLARLERVEAALAEIDPAYAQRSFGVMLMRQSLETRRDQVFGDVYGRLELALTRDEPLGTGAEIALVGPVLSSFQDSLASVAQVLAGQGTARGMIPAAIKEVVALRVVAARPGSLKLELVPVSPSQEPLFEDGEGSLLELSMDRLLGLLDTGQTNPGDLLQDIADLGPRVTTHVHDLAKWLSDSRASVSMDWQSPAVRRAARLDAPKAQRLRAVLEEVETTTRERVVTGVLVGGSLVRGTFELEIDDPPEKTIIGGEVHGDALSELKRFFGQPVTAELEVREAQLRSGETRDTHLLKSLSE